MTLTPGAVALCPGRVLHRRNTPTVHAFTQPVSMIWLDPDQPEELFHRHPLWSARRAAPVHFRSSDYGTATAPLGSAGVRTELQEHLGFWPRGPVRMLTQPRRWGWLFNPFTLYLAWDRDLQSEHAATDPVGAVIEVTNTPWKERHRYPIELERRGHQLVSRFDKRQHVSPFLGDDYRYELRLPDGPGRFVVELDVVRPAAMAGEAAEPPVLETMLDVDLDTFSRPPTKAQMTRFMTRNPLATHRVSAGIHAHAAWLLAKRVPFVPHPRTTPSTPTTSTTTVADRQGARLR